MSKIAAQTPARPEAEFSKRMPPLISLWYFSVAARKKSFVAAAKELNVTPAAISHQIKGLEEHLGVLLFVRHHRKVSLTAEGQLALPLLAEGFGKLAEAVEHIQLQSSEKSVITVCAEPLFATKWLVPRLHRFYARCPDAEVRLQASLSSIDSENSSTTPTTFRRSGIDINVRYGLGHYSELLVDLLWSVRLNPVCAPSLMESAPTSAVENLFALPLLSDLTSDRALQSFGWSEWFQSAGCPNSHKLKETYFGNALLALEAASSGQGLLLADRKVLASELSLGRLAIAHELELECPYSYYVVCPPDTLRHHVAGEFRNWMLEEARSSMD